MTAARADTESLSWTASQSISRYSGSVFASSIVDTLQSATDEVEGQLTDQDRTDADAKLMSLDNTSAEKLKTKTFIELCRSVRRACNKRHRLVDQHRFSFSSQDDEWGLSWNQTTAIQLASFAQRWARLETYPYTGSEQSKSNLDPSPNNPEFAKIGPSQAGHQALDWYQEKEPTIRSINAALPIQRSRSHSQDGAGLGPLHGSALKERIKNIVQLMKQQCPGEENGGYNHMLYYFMDRCAMTGQNTLPPDPDSGGVGSEDDHWDLQAIVHYRLTVAELAVYGIVDALRLPRPNGETCLQWHRFEWEQAMIQDPRNTVSNVWELEKVQRRLWDYMVARHDFKKTVEPTPEQGPKLTRFHSYIIAAIFEAHLDNEAAENEIMDKVAAILSGHEEYFKHIAQNDKHVQKVWKEFTALETAKPKKRRSILR
ncbi:hypothetical protein SPBR_03954 [Sporothrix brasiliensis 5110]|uniref:Uncharacterized protein n=1 Tax=Sporothrix brasiliensis 5110 TaxID=1398154 RepID=A0A0C2FWB1_9PEZI|nr:uncharacterized protein SPBR_03954 [Sporothrix brasiliensis 5110]KIH95328.1 hypothetical protein SPBR_03954 [Sporothrix brasiliensis 5110]